MGDADGGRVSSYPAETQSLPPRGVPDIHWAIINYQPKTINAPSFPGTASLLECPQNGSFRGIPERISDILWGNHVRMQSPGSTYASVSVIWTQLQLLCS